MRNGHPWDKVKNYTLYEIGIVHRVCLRHEIETKRNKLIDEITNVWLGTHLDHKGLLKLTSDLNKKQTNGTVKTKDGKREESEQLQNIRKVVGIMGGMR